MGLFARFSRNMELMSRMWQQTGVVENAARAGLSEAELQSAVGRCAGCKATMDCESWLNENPDESRAPGFCANVTMIDRLQKAMD